MNERQKHEIDALRRKGHTYAYIADKLDLPMNTVKSYCRRSQEQPDDDLCRNCGNPVWQHPRARQKHFCSNRCRQIWWNGNRDKINHRDTRTVECAYCGCEFRAHGKRQRKYCSPACCAADRGGA